MKKSLFVIALLPSMISAIHTQQSINALTLYPGAPDFCTLQLIDQIIYKINRHNIVPEKSYIPINNQLYTLAQGIKISKNDTIVAIFSRGYAKTNQFGTNGNFLMRGACAISAYIQFRDSIVTGMPLISFDYDDSKSGFCFGQKNEIDTLAFVHREILAQNPHIPIILIGDCRGAKVVLEFLTQRPSNVAAVILMTPFVSAYDLTNKIAQNYLHNVPLSKALLHNFFKFYFTNYKSKYDNLAQRLHFIDPNIPILIAHRKHDTLVGPSTVENLVKTLKKQGNQDVRWIITEDQEFEHSMLTGNSEVREAINCFLRDYGLPHNPALIAAP